MMNLTDPSILLMNRLYRKCMAYKRFVVNSTSYDNSTEGEKYCPVVFDGYLCWGPAVANSTETQNCPRHVIGYDERLVASKRCTEDGTWWAHPQSNKVWTDYTACINQHDYGSRQLINNIYFYGYCVSLLALLVSLVIFLSFRSLRCTRIHIHTQLFASLALNCIFWIAWFPLVVSSPDVVSKNPLWCIVLHILTQYFMLCNYFWMFCEGVHLHLVLVVVFVKDNVARRIFMFIGWGLPMIYVGIYSFMRFGNESNNKLCWVDESYYNWILTVPVMILLLCSAIFLINIVRVLITKLHPKSVSPAPIAIKKAVRATLILIPLFGLQHCLLPFRPDKESSLEFPYQLLSAVLISSQGFCVSLLFCFLNHEVISAVHNRLESLCPRFFPNPNRRYAPPATTTQRDMVV